MPLHQPARAVGRAHRGQRGRAGAAGTRDTVARRHDAPVAESAGVHAAAGCACAQTAAAPVRVPRGAGAQREAARPGGAAGAARSGANDHRTSGRRRVRSRDGSGPARRIRRARLLERVFDIDLRRCPRCGAGQVRIIAAILRRAVIRKILTHLGLDPQPPPRSKVREAGHELCALAVGAHAGTRPVVCSGWRAARVALCDVRATCPRAAKLQSEPRIAIRERSQPPRGHSPVSPEG
jgi:hypothetical protein